MFLDDVGNGLMASSEMAIPNKMPVIRLKKLAQKAENARFLTGFTLSNITIKLLIVHIIFAKYTIKHTLSLALRMMMGECGEWCTETAEIGWHSYLAKDLLLLSCKKTYAYQHPKDVRCASHKRDKTHA